MPCLRRVQWASPAPLTHVRERPGQAGGWPETPAPVPERVSPQVATGRWCPELAPIPLTEASRVRTGRIKALDATALTEGVLRLVGIEGVRGDAVGSLQKLEARGRDNEVFVLLLLADAAVAVEDVQVSRSPNFKAHGPTVAASCVFHQALVFAGGRNQRD